MVKRLMKNRGELIERSFSHCYDTGGMRRTHLRLQRRFEREIDLVATLQHVDRCLLLRRVL